MINFVLRGMENTNFYAVVTPLRKAASYEQRKTNLGEKKKNLGAVLSCSATYYAALTRVSSLPPRRRHDSYVESADFT